MPSQVNWRTGFLGIIPEAWDSPSKSGFARPPGGKDWRPANLTREERRRLEWRAREASAALLPRVTARARNTRRDWQDTKAIYEWFKSLGGPGLPQGFIDQFNSKTNPNLNPKGGYKPTSYTDEGGGSRGGYFGSKDYPALDPNIGQKAGGGGKFGPETSGGDANSNAAGLGGSDYLKAQRARFAEELKNPGRTVRYLGIEVDDALAIAEQVDV
jgi:hypothetical protein